MDKKMLSMVMQKDAGALMRYREALAMEDRKVFDRLLDLAKGHAPACAHANRLNLFESMLFAMVLEQQKVIERLTAAGAMNNG